MRRISEAHKRRLARLEQHRKTYPRAVMMWWKEVVRKRAEETAKLLDFRPYRGDVHVHSTYSDGTGTVEEIKGFADQAGLDFLFITDHDTVNQKRSCRRFENVWWGQEPGAQGHHLGILGLERKYQPKNPLVYDYNRVQQLGGVAFIPHPTGWFRAKYDSQSINVLETLGDDFAMEILNGANQIFDCFDETDQTALALWDRLLSLDKRVVGLGATDAHLAEAIGDVWTGVLAPKLSREEVLNAIRKGHCYVSDGPALSLWLGDKGMGDTVEAPKGELTLRYQCADSRGLDRVRLISHGRLVKTLAGRGRPLLEGEIRVRFTGGRAYFRLECFAVDERRAYGNPIYLREA